jgi:hypothetical protein
MNAEGADIAIKITTWWVKNESTAGDIGWIAGNSGAFLQQGLQE